MKCLIPVLSLIIFLIQMHAIFMSNDSSSDSSSKLLTDIKGIKEIKDKNEASYCSSTEYIFICICKCCLGFLAGVVFSDMKFIKFGVI